MVKIYFLCVSVSLAQSELQSLHFPSAPFFIAIFFLLITNFLLPLSVDTVSQTRSIFMTNLSMTYRS